MSDILRAAETASRAGLVEALGFAAACGHTATAETLLGVLAARFGSVGEPAALAVGRAADAGRWATVAYLADFLADTTRAGGGGVGDGVRRGLLRRLAPAGGAGALPPFRLAGAIVDTPPGGGAGALPPFRLADAIVDTPPGGPAPRGWP